MNDTPDMSVVLVTPKHYETIRQAVKHLREQQPRDRLEIVIVAPAKDELELDEVELAGFFGVTVVEIGEIKTTGAAVVAGIRRARAPVVVYVEEHSYPAPGWAEALIAAHRQPWAAVGPVLLNANPGSLISWAHLFSDFSAWVAPAAGGVATALPSHQTSYKRDLLLEYGTQLDSMMESESSVQKDLRDRGHKLYLEPGAATRHVNVSRLGSLLKVEFHGYRMFGTVRAATGHWSVFRRLLYIVGGPLIPLVRLRRILSEIRRCGRQRELLPGILPALFAGLAAGALGEMVGYCFGAGDAAQKRLSFELDRRSHTCDAHLQKL